MIGCIKSKEFIDACIKICENNEVKIQGSDAYGGCEVYSVDNGSIKITIKFFNQFGAIDTTFIIHDSSLVCLTVEFDGEVIPLSDIEKETLTFFIFSKIDIDVANNIERLNRGREDFINYVGKNYKEDEEL